MRLLAGSAAVLVLLFATACGGGSGSQPTSAPGGATSAPGATTAASAPPPGATAKGPAAATECAAEAAGSGPVISMEGTHALNPSDESVSVGDAVTWTNNSKTNHQIAFTGGPTCTFTLIGKSVSITFNTAGAFPYICKIHPTFMKGTITVQ